MLRRSALVLVAVLTFAACSSTERATQPEVPPAPTLDPAFLAEPLGLDPDVRTDTLANGLRYYIRRNTEPEDRAELRLVVDAGSVLEDEDQRGLAHFVEHMAFNGTERYAENELVDYLEGIGMQFGPDLNAYTSFDETVYMLQVPTDTTGLLATGLDILKEWASAITLEGAAIDAERGVVLEEWRQGRGAQARVSDEQFPILFGGSRYAERLPIGDPEVLENAPYEALRRFYETWYRPDLMAVVAVGDFDPDAVEQMIRTTFDELENPADAPPRPSFDVPPHDETRFAIATDPELTTTSVAVLYKEPADRGQDVAALRDRLMDRLYNRMLNVRLYERTQQADAPYLGAFTGKFGFARPADLYVMQAVVGDGGVPTGLEAILTEAARVQQHGFTAGELDRMKADLLREYEVAYNERENAESGRLASEYVSLFLEGEPAPGIAREYDLVQRLLPSITLRELNALADEVVSEENRVVFVSAPEKEGVPVPSEEELRAVFETVEAKEIEPYVEAVAAGPLVPNPPEPVPVASVSDYADGSGVTEFVLDNGVRVVLKPTDFKADEVLFSAFSPGGTSLVADSLFRSAEAASAVVNLGGVGDFSETELDKKLAGQAVRVRPYVSEREEGLSGSASPQDLETLFQLVHLYFTAPREDEEAFTAYKQRIDALLENRDAQPEAAFSDTLQATLAQYHPRRLPFDEEALAEIELDEALGVYRDRFRDASDFTFVFVGAFDVAEIEPLVEQYLATLPATGREEALSGSASPEDLETLFQLVHLYFTAPREDAEAFAAYEQRIEALLANRDAQPEAAFSDTLQVTLAQYHPRRLPFDEEALAEIELDEALDVYRDRFRDASDFTFVFVGAFDVAEIEPLVEQYLATLPATGREEAPRDLGVRPPEDVVEKTVRRGIEPKARVQLVFSGTLDVRVDTLDYADSLMINDEWVPVADSVYTARHEAARAERYLLGALADAFRIRLRETLREDRGGVYGVGANASVDRMLGTYTIAIGFGCDPERVDELTDAVFEVIERFKQDGPEDALDKVKEADRRQQQLALEENEAWLGALGAAYRYDEAPMPYLDKSDLIDELTYGALRGAAQYYLDLDRYVQVVLLPEG